MKAKNYPEQQPRSITVTTHRLMAADIKGKFVPRPPREGELMLVLGRPQSASGEFGEFAVGDLIGGHGSGDTKIYAGDLNGVELQAAWVTDEVWSLAVRALAANDEAKLALADALAAAGCCDTIVAAIRSRVRGIVPKILGCRGQSYVVVAAKHGYTRSGESGSWKVWEQLVVVRLATAADHDAVAGQKASQEAEDQRILTAMQDR